MNIGSTTRLLGFDLFYSLRHDFLLGDGGLLVIADGHAGRRTGHQLPRASTGGHHELEGVWKLGAVNHTNVLKIPSASPCIHLSRARSARTIPRNRSTAAVSSSL